jgi:squalene synthase HpnC
LEAADRHCRSLATRHYENFAVASRFLARDIRVDLTRVYAYCRTTDDLGDESGGHGRARLARWRRDVEDLFAGAMPVHPVLLALQGTIERRGLPSEPFVDLIAANEQDQEITAYREWSALLGYCMLSAAPVGRIVLRVFGLRDPALEPLSDDVCVGLQLANFAQDVGRDARIGRSYLLGTEVEASGVAGATRAMCDRARTLLASGRALERAAPGALRLQLALYRLGGLAICDAIERQGYATSDKRPEVSKSSKFMLLLRGAFEAATVAGGGGRAQHA